MLTLVVLPFDEADDGTVRRWRVEHPDRMVTDNLDTAAAPSLFGSGDVEIHGENFLAGDLRAFARDLGEDRHALVIVRKKTSANFSSDPITLVDLTPPKGRAALSAHLSDLLGIPRAVATTAVDRAATAKSAVGLCRQLALLDDTSDRRVSGMALDPSATAPPWSVTDAICRGRPGDAAEAAREFARTIPVGSALFQIVGFMRKVVVAGHDPGGVLSGGNPGFFASRRRGLRDSAGLIADLSEATESVLSARHPEYALAASVAMMASRFSMERT